MWALLRAPAAVALLALASGASLRAAPSKAANSTALAAGAGDAAKVKELRGQLEKMSAGLVHMLAPNGTLAKMKIGSAMKSFEAELEKTLRETANMQAAQALPRLESAQAGVQGLVKDISSQQIQLMRESDAQKESLLLGVLMTRQKQPMDKQLQVLEASDFKGLAVTKALLEKHDAKTPLFQQVAAFLDAHGGKAPVPAPPALVKTGKDGKPDVSGLVAALQLRLHHLEESAKREKHLHEVVMSELDEAARKEAKTSKKSAHRIQLMKKSENRKFVKQSAMGSHDIASLKAAIAAIQMGDLKALAKAQSALEASIKAMQAQSGGFLYLVQLGHRTQGLDCPYCAAQCFDKCHSSGKSYTTCLTQCADAGK